ESALPELIARPRAALVQVTSGLALSPKASAPVYCATKSGLRAFTRALRWQLARTNVCVLEVLPPLVDTAMTRGRGRGKMSPEDVAAEIVAALRRGDTEAYLGKSKLLRWLSWIAPHLAAAITRPM
ncbi:MAG: SDR family NAD(P)-dependent oxidoreductase, partial [Myxococcota bacterium]